MNRKCCSTDYKTWHHKHCKKSCPDNKYFISCTSYPTQCKNGKVFKYRKYVNCGIQDPCYLKCSHYNKDCQCEECNEKYMRCYYKCKGKNTCCNNVNKPLNPNKPCLFGTIGVIYPVINQNMYPCGPCN